MTLVRELAGVLCDDVRFEIGKKVSLMGVFANHIRVREAPARFRRLHVFKRLEFVERPRELSVELALFGPDGSNLLSEPGSAPSLPELKVADEVHFAVGFGPLTLETAGEYTIELTFREGAAEQRLEHRFTLIFDK